MSPKIVVPIAVIFISFSAIFIRLSEAPPLAIATYRMAFSTLFLLPLLLVGAAPPAMSGAAAETARRRGTAARVAHDRRIARPDLGINLADLALCLLSGVFLALHFATWIASVDMTSIASSTVLVNLQPIFVLGAGALVLRERSSLRAILMILVTIVGCGILSFGDARAGGHRLAGDGLALLGAVFVAGYMIIGRIVRRRLTARTYTLVVYGSSTIVLLLIDLVTATPLWPFRLEDWLLFAALAIFCTLLGHSLLNWALKYVKASVIATSVLGEPVIATLLAIPFFGELPSLLSLAGGLVAIGGLYFFIRAERHPQIETRTA